MGTTRETFRANVEAMEGSKTGTIKQGCEVVAQNKDNVLIFGKECLTATQATQALYHV